MLVKSAANAETLARAEAIMQEELPREILPGGGSVIPVSLATISEMPMSVVAVAVAVLTIEEIG